MLTYEKIALVVLKICKAVFENNIFFNFRYRLSLKTSKEVKKKIATLDI